jgi:hypothetical protein
MPKLVHLRKREKLSTMVTPEIRAALASEADRRGTTLGAIAREALTDWTIQKLQSEKAKTPAA